MPSVDAVLKHLSHLVERWGHQQVGHVVRVELEGIRRQLDDGCQPPVSIKAIEAAVNVALDEQNRSTLRPVINLTGTVLHTNLGRAVLPREALQAVMTAAMSPTNLEYDLVTGARGERDSHVEALLCELTGAEAATVVNNNAAAVLLVLNTLAAHAEVPTSRGELVEIGGSFRIPEVMERSGCRLVEVGSTNRTHLKDYENAIGEKTALLMKVHTSNYRVEGFTHSVEEKDLARLAHKYQLPFVVDMGSGSLIDFSSLGLPDEPTAAATIANGADIVTFSGDKLLGGPQCGIIAGREELVTRIRNNPLKRALRLDKMTLAALAEVLKLYRNPATLAQKLPTLRLLTRPLADIKAQAERLLPKTRSLLAPLYRVAIKACHSQIGSGALPVETLPSFAFEISSVESRDIDVRRLAAALRSLPLPIIGRICNGALLLDLRCLECEPEFEQQLDQLGERLQ